MIDCKELLYHFGGSVSSDILGSEYNILFVRFLFMSSLMRHKMGRGGRSCQSLRKHKDGSIQKANYPMKSIP